MSASYDDTFRALFQWYQEAVLAELKRGGPFYADTRTPEEMAAHRAAIEEQRAKDRAALDDFMTEFVELMERHPAIRFYDPGYETEGVEVTVGSVGVRLVDGRPGGLW